MTIIITLEHSTDELLTIDRNYEDETTRIGIDDYGTEAGITVSTPELLRLLEVAGLR